MEVYMKELNYCIEKHEKMLNFMISHKDADGICTLSQGDIAEHLGLGRTTVKNMIDRLNILDDCVEKVGRSKYKVHYTELREQGIFREILRCLPQVIIWHLEGTKSNLLEKAKLLNTTVKVVQILEGYIMYEVCHFQDDSKIDPPHS